MARQGGAELGGSRLITRHLEPQDWPDDIACYVKAFHRGSSGFGVVLHDSLQALQMILQQTGRLQPRDSVDVLAEAIRADVARQVGAERLLRDTPARKRD